MYTICQYAYANCSDASTRAFLLALTDTAIEKKPFNPSEVYFMRGVLLFNGGERETAEACFAKSLEYCTSEESRKRRSELIEEAKADHRKT